jgi:hypothetical protein
MPLISYATRIIECGYHRRDQARLTTAATHAADTRENAWATKQSSIALRISPPSATHDTSGSVRIRSGCTERQDEVARDAGVHTYSRGRGADSTQSMLSCRTSSPGLPLAICPSTDPGPHKRDVRLLPAARLAGGEELAA